MGKSIQMKDNTNEKMYPHPYFPIGSIYLSINNINPSKWFDGTWELIAQGRTLVGVDTNDSDFNEPKKTGGEKTHTLSTDEMPSHNHGIVNFNNWGASGTGSGYQYYNNKTDLMGNNGTSYKGGSQAHNNLQPYFTCYIWCRTA